MRKKRYFLKLCKWLVLLLLGAAFWVSGKEPKKVEKLNFFQVGKEVIKDSFIKQMVYSQSMILGFLLEQENVFWNQNAVIRVESIIPFEEKEYVLATEEQLIDDFMKENPGAYKYAKDKGLLDKIRADLKYKTVHWTDETVKAEALQYTTYNDFYLNSISAFGYAKRNGLLRSFTWLQKVDRIMDINPCFEKAKEYSTLTEFKSNCPKEYQYIKNKKRLKELTWLKRNK